MKSLKKYMAHKMASGEHEHMPKIGKEEADEISGGEDYDDGAMAGVKHEFSEKKSHKNRMNPDHAKLLGMEEDEDCY